MPELLTTQAISLSEELLYNALPIGKFHDPRYGEVNITPDLVTGLAANVGKAPSYPPPVKIGHGDGAPSPGVVKEAIAKPDGLYLRMEVDDKAAEEIRNGRYRYMSAEYTPDYTDKKTGKKVGAALLGVALVNQPGHPGVKPLFLSDSGAWEQGESTEPTNDPAPAPDDNEKGGKNMDPEKIKELEAKLADLEAKNKELSDKAEENKKLADASAAEAEKLRKEKHEADVKAFCDGWVGKGVPPVVMDKIRPVLMADDSKVIKLSDDKQTDLKTLLNDVLGSVPKISLSAMGDPAAEAKVEATKAIELGDDIAACANGQKEEK